MSYFEFPHTRTYEGDLGYVIKRIIELSAQFDEFISLNQITFADPIEWRITSQYAPFTIVVNSETQYSYISKKPVPPGITLNNSEYWQILGAINVDVLARAEIAELNAQVATLTSGLTTERLQRIDKDASIELEIENANNDISELRTAINDEVANRTSADAVINARIDEITSLPEGSTTGDAELADIRVGGNGVTYSTAGDAVRAQYDILNNDIYYSRNSSKSLTDTESGDQRIVTDTWYHGQVSNTGVYIDANDFICSMPIYDINNNLKIDLGSFALGSGNLALFVRGFDKTTGTFTTYINNLNMSTVNPAWDINDYVTGSLNCSVCWVFFRKMVGGVSSAYTATEYANADKYIKVYKKMIGQTVSRTSKHNSFYRESTPKYTINLNADFIYMTRYEDRIPADATTIRIDYYALEVGTPKIYIINAATWKVLKILTPTSEVGMNSVEVNVADYHCEITLGYYAGTKGALTRQNAVGATYTMTYPSSALFAWYASPSGIIEGSTISPTNWSANVSTSKNYICASVYVTRPVNVKKASVIHVDKNGGGDYTTIRDAIRNAGDIGSHTTIIVHPGTYNEVVWMEGDNHISLVGTDKDTCIITQASGRYLDSPIVINGWGTIENLTIKMLVDGSFTPTYSDNVLQSYPGYAVHADGAQFNTSNEVIKRVSNCILYSEAFPALGTGSNKNQNVIIENCELIRNCSNSAFQRDNWRGAFVSHASNTASDTNCIFTMKDSVCKSNYGYAGNIRGDLAGASGYTVVAINNTFYSSETGSVNNVVYDQGASTLSPMSHGNTATNLNT